jgi:hypothetical protein
VVAVQEDEVEGRSASLFDVETARYFFNSSLFQCRRATNDAQGEYAVPDLDSPDQPLRP